MLDISLPTANALFGFSNIALIVGGVLVLIGSVGVFWAGNVRDRYADQRASDNETKTAVAVAESARANESNTLLQIELEKERAERIRLEQKVAPRRLSNTQRAKIIAGMRSSGWQEAEVIWHGTGEPEAYAKDFATAFKEAGLDTRVHTLGMFIPSAWGLMVVVTTNDVSDRFKAILDEAGMSPALAETNDTLGKKQNPTLFIGTRED